MRSWTSAQAEQEYKDEKTGLEKTEKNSGMENTENRCPQMTEARKEEYRAFLAQHMEKADLADLEINSWLEQCDRFLQEHACTDRTVYELEPEALENVLDVLRGGELLHALKRQKNGRLLRALERYTAYRTGNIDITENKDRARKTGPAAPDRKLPAAPRLSGSLTELLTEADPGNPEGIPEWRTEPAFPTRQQKQILERERKRRELEEAASDRKLVREALEQQRKLDAADAAAAAFGRGSRIQDNHSRDREFRNTDVTSSTIQNPDVRKIYEKDLEKLEKIEERLERLEKERQNAGGSPAPAQVVVQVLPGSGQGVQTPVKGTGPVQAEAADSIEGAVPAGTQQHPGAAETENDHSAVPADEKTLLQPVESGKTKEGEETAEESAKESAEESADDSGFSSEKAGEQEAPAEKRSPLDDPDFVPRSMKILIGQTIGEEVPRDYYWEPNNTSRVFHMNTGIIGTMGTGKTQFTKSLIAQLMQNAQDNFDGTKPGLLIFDYKGDYNESKRDFVDAVQARVIKPYQLPFNPFSLAETRTFRPLLPTHTANAFKDILARVYRLGPKQQSSLFRCIMSAYESRGVVSAKPDTWKADPPTYADVYEIYEKDETIPKSDSLAAAMNKLHMFELFEKDSDRIGTLFDLLRGTVVVDLSGYDPDIQSLVVAIMLQLFYTQMVASGSSMLRDNLRQITRMVLVDEADNFMSEDFPALKKILKEGREFGVGVVLSTQSLKHFQTEDNSYADYIMTWVVHNVADLKDKDVDFVFRVPARSRKETELLRRVRELEKFQSIVKVGNEEPVRVRDLAFWELLEGKGKRAETPEDEAPADAKMSADSSDK